ncbi:hypothetical protein DUNSADRAFT_16028 [Dunaliella salina]|uniref:Uncharacterized protein n=1 Tax=Dunaliella salina TaxID=3046 RepID=A0ABQ7H1B6_DUNSA|nr:hypothetical protein DUNSADRAFT_16028 [Dunaliella salina]|eukprot:KAF5840655.1 hypothetical protein DUNSADRAFT_16028 [Dunaliella salina]
MSTVLSLLAVNGRPASSAYHRGGPPPLQTDKLLASKQADTLLSSDQLLQQLRQSRISTPIIGSSAAQTGIAGPRPQTEYGRHFNSRPFHVPPPSNPRLQPDSRTTAAAAPAAAAAAAAPAAAAPAFPSHATATPQSPEPRSTLTTSPPSHPDHPLNAQRAHNMQHPSAPTPQNILLQPHLGPPNPHSPLSTLTLHAPPSSTKLAGPAVGTSSTLSSSPFQPRTHRCSANNSAATAASPPRRNNDGGAPRVRPHACKPHRPGSILVPLPACASAPAHTSESLVGLEKLQNGWSGGLTGASSAGSAASRRGGQPGAKHAVPGAAGVLPPSKDHPSFISARSCPSRPSTANPITHSLVDIPGKASFPQLPPPVVETTRGLPAWPRQPPSSMRATSSGAIACSHTKRPSSRPNTSSTSCNRPLLGASRSVPTSSSSSSGCTGLSGPFHATPKNRAGASGLQGSLQQHGVHDDAQTRQHAGQGTGAAARAPQGGLQLQHGPQGAQTQQQAGQGMAAAAAAAHAPGVGAGTAAATKLSPDTKEPHTAQQQPHTLAPAHPLCCSTKSTSPSPSRPASIQHAASRTSPSQSNQAPANPPTAASTLAPTHASPHTHGTPLPKGPPEQQHAPQGLLTPAASPLPPQPAPLSSLQRSTPLSSPPSCHQAEKRARGCQEGDSTRPTSSASSVWSTLVQAPTALPPAFPNAQPGIQGEGVGGTLDHSNALAAAPAHKHVATASQLAQQENEARQQLEQLQQLRGAGRRGLPSTNCRDSRPDTPWTVQVAKAVGQANDEDATSIDIVSTPGPGTSTAVSRAFTPAGKPYNNVASKRDQQRSNLAPFVRQAAPMVLCVEDPAQSSEEVLEMELQRKLRELSLDELRRINALL